MADIAQEIETLASHFGGVATFERIWRQALPAKYVANQLSIRYQGDSSESETAYHYRIDREYQVVYFAATELACLQRATLLQRAINQHAKIRIKDTDGYMTLASFSVSQPFKTETDGVFAIVGVLQAQVREARYFAPVSKISNIDIAIAPVDPVAVAELDTIRMAQTVSADSTSASVVYPRVGKITTK